MVYEIEPCIVTTSGDVLTYEFLKTHYLDELKRKKEQLIKKGYDEKTIDEFIEDIENFEGGVCGSEDRLQKYIDILYELDNS